MADKATALSIVIRAVDQATGGVRKIGEHIKGLGDGLFMLTVPARLVGERLAALGREAGLPKIAEAAKGVGGAFQDLGSKLLGTGAVVAAGVTAAATAMLHLSEEFDDLGDKAEQRGVSADFLAQIRYAAERSGAAVEQADQGMRTFAQGLGEARANAGPLVEFLSRVSPRLLLQLKAAKSNEAAFELMAKAMAKIQDPAKRAALAQKVFGDSALAPLLARGADGIDELRTAYKKFAGSQEEAVAAAGGVDDAMKDLKAATSGVKAALVTGLGPAMKVVINHMRDWLVGHRDDIGRWAKDIGERLPGAVDAVVRAVERGVSEVRSFVDSIGGLKVAGIAVAGVMAGPLLSSFVTLGATMLSTPFGAVLASLAAISALVISITREIEIMSEAMDTTREEMLQDSVSMTPGEFHRKYPQLRGKDDDGALAFWDSLAHPENAPGRGTWSMFNTGGMESLWSKPPPSILNMGAGAGPAAPAEARVKIEIANAPRGTRVTTDPGNTADVHTSVGYQMGFDP